MLLTVQIQLVKMEEPVMRTKRENLFLHASKYLNFWFLFWLSLLELPLSSSCGFFGEVGSAFCVTFCGYASSIESVWNFFLSFQWGRFFLCYNPQDNSYITIHCFYFCLTCYGCTCGSFELFSHASIHLGTSLNIATLLLFVTVPFV